MKIARRFVATATLLVVADFAPSLLAAQEPTDPHAVQPERPTVATHAFTVAPGWVELEIGGERDAVAGGTLVSTPATLKIGLAPRAQLGLVLDSFHPSAGAVGAPGFGDAAVDVKLRLVDDAPVVGAFAILPSLKLPTGSLAAGSGTGTTDAGLLLISSHRFGPYSLDINVGATRRTGRGAGQATPRTATLWTTSLGTPLAGPFGYAAEIYGYPGTGGPAGVPPIVAFLTGPTLSIETWLAADAGVIVPLHGPQPRAAYAGMVWNIGRL